MTGATCSTDQTEVSGLLAENDSDENDASSTELKLALLTSLHQDVDQATLLDLLIAANGSVSHVDRILKVSDVVSEPPPDSRKRSIGIQTSLKHYGRADSVDKQQVTHGKRRMLTRKGQTLHLFDPDDVAVHTPCSIIHNFLPAQLADSLLKELLTEAPTYERQNFQLFDNVVQSPHTACFYVEDLEERNRQKTEYLYNGSYLKDVRQITPQMQAVAPLVKAAINEEIKQRIERFYPSQEKLRYQSPDEWIPNAAFVNCYKGGGESVGYHSDQLTYLGPRSVIGSVSLGVSREFRVRKIVARETDMSDAQTHDQDAQGQIAIHLPHNSLLVMHAEMQEEWKHSIHPANVIEPHPMAGICRINITYRHYRSILHPRYTPRCRCGVATVLRCVQRKKSSHGRYMWMCHVGNTANKAQKGCTFFQWADFDDDGEPAWSTRYKARPSNDDSEKTSSILLAKHE